MSVLLSEFELELLGEEWAKDNALTTMLNDYRYLLTKCKNDARDVAKMIRGIASDQFIL